MPPRTHNAPYREWQIVPVTIAGEPLAMATKPGALAHGDVDPAAQMLADSVSVTADDVVVQMHSGNGLLATVAARSGARVFVTDRNVIAAEASRRTLEANGVSASVLLGQGTLPLPGGTVATLVAIRLPTEKMAVRQLLGDAFAVLAIGGRCIIAGANNEGAKSAARMLERIFGNAAVVDQHSGCRAVLAVKRSAEPNSAEDLADPLLRADRFHESPVTMRGLSFVVSSRPGVFSWDHADEATALLAHEMHVAPGESVLDLGCGAGALGVVAAKLSGSGHVTLVDSDTEAVRSAQRTVEAAGLTNCTVLPSDVASAVLDQQFDVVVTNPPFHVGKATDLRVPHQFIEDAWQLLRPGGRLYLVANRTLPYEAMITARFGNCAMKHDGQRFKVLAATK
jgi:16S rRNA (guanine1207-N2)-methyltransferase